MYTTDYTCFYKQHQFCGFYNIPNIFVLFHFPPTIWRKKISYSTGWGQTSGINPFPPNHLQWAQLPIQTSENCQNIYSGTITEGEICAGDDKATVCNVSTYVVVWHLVTEISSKIVPEIVHKLSITLLHYIFVNYKRLRSCSRILDVFPAAVT